MTEQRRATILLIGANGQVGWELRHILPAIGIVVALDHSTLDVTDHDAIRRVVAATVPTVIVNAAAYTQVDLAESEPTLAYRVNAEAPAVLAHIAREIDALLIHYSTDYVFDGTATLPYREDDLPNPLNVYGHSKLAGDTAVLASGSAAYLFRVAWVYGERSRNFVRTFKRLAREGKELRIVADQYGGPTWCRSIANGTSAVLAQLLSARAEGTAIAAPGVYHMAPPDSTTWAEFAQEIVRTTTLVGDRAVVTPITTREYPTSARRPAWSVLDSNRLRTTFGVQLPPWREQLASCLASGGND